MTGKKIYKKAAAEDLAADPMDEDEELLPMEEDGLSTKICLS